MRMQPPIPSQYEPDLAIDLATVINYVYDRCPCCGSRVPLLSSDEGTSSFLAVDTESLTVANDLLRTHNTELLQENQSLRERLQKGRSEILECDVAGEGEPGMSLSPKENAVISAAQVYVAAIEACNEFWELPALKRCNTIAVEVDEKADAAYEALKEALQALELAR